MSSAQHPAYTTNQITAGPLDGPVAGTLMMRGDLIAPGEVDRARETLAYRLPGPFAILVLVFMLPDQVPNTALPIGYTVAFRTVAKQFGMDRKALVERGCAIGSNWRVAGMSILWLALTAIAISAAVFALVSVGVPPAHHRRCVSALTAAVSTGGTVGRQGCPRCRRGT